MLDYIKTLEEEFQRKADKKIAAQQKAYMRNQFEYFGLMTPTRKEVSKPFLVKNALPKKEDLSEVVKLLWQKPQREFIYFAHALVSKYKKEFVIEDLALFEYMIVNKSWWDTIDFIAPNLLAQYFKMFPEMRDKTIKRWLASGNIWLQRSSILFQLKYKTELDTEFLSYVIHELLGTNEFFIDKAIGWILREYGKTNPDWVVAFSKKTALSNLSRREGLRIILKTNDL